MRIRTKLILAFLLLAVVPLAAIVFINYLSSIEVFRRGVEAEVRSQALELNDRMEEARDELGRRIRALGTMSLASLAPEALPGEEPHLMDSGMMAGGDMEELGDLAPMVESVEVLPVAPRPGPPPDRPSPPAPPTPLGGGEWDDAWPEDGEETGPAWADAFVIYLDQVVDAAAAEVDTEALEESAAAATGELLRSLGADLDARAERFAEVTEELDRRLEDNERQVQELSEALQRPGLSIERRERLNEERRRAVRSLRQAARDKQVLEQGEIDALQRGWEQAQGILGRSFDWSIERDGEVVGRVRAQISPENLLASILGRTRREQGEIPFAVGPDRSLYTVKAEDKRRLAPLTLEELTVEPDAPYVAYRDGWLVVASVAPESDVTLGIARPIAASLADVRQNAVRNFAFGLAAIFLAMIGILPLSRRMTRDVRELSRSVDRLAAGESDVTVDVASRDEIGQLARNFNRMAADLHDQRERLIDEVRRREEQETRERLLAAENERKSRELEDARAFQLSLLPAEVPRHPDLSMAVHMRTATEVGGDYYDFLTGDDGSLTVAVGDATGHGAKAGTMVTAIKSLFTASAGVAEPAEFLGHSSHIIKRMNLDRMAMALVVARYDEGRVQVASAGMPPPLLWRARTGEVVELELPGLPLGGLADSTYEQTDAEMAQGDMLLLMSDGLPELPDPAGDPLGYPAVKRIFGSLASRPPHDVLAGLQAAAEDWRDERPILDDITFVLLQRVGPGAAS